MRIKHEDDCLHFVCRGKRIGPHHERCPTSLHLSDGDVLAFASTQISTKQTTNPRKVIYHAHFRGYTASLGPACPRSSSCIPTPEERWLAEELIMFDRNGGKR